MKSRMMILSLTMGIVLTGIALGAVSACAQAGGVEAKIPFSFVVSGKTFPAGEYTMMAASSDEIRIQDATGKPIAIVLANQVSRHSTDTAGHIVFHCYSDRCFLAEMWFSARENGRQLLTSATEENLAREQKRKYFAVLGLAAAK